MKISSASPGPKNRLIQVKLEDPILRTFILFTQTAHVVLKYIDTQFYRNAGLSLIKFVVLQILAANGGTMEPSRIAEWTLRERHDITTLVERMQRDGLVRTERNEKDRRFVNITLTDKGSRLRNKAVPVARKIVKEIMESITEEDTSQLEKLLSVLRQNAHYGLRQVARRPQKPPG
jgi:MarR family 2-MHQ and catechol resistance regulon transcriptional repressor